MNSRKSTKFFFSLIICTLGRVNELEELLKSLLKQSFTEFEIIIVDQNDEINLTTMLSIYQNQLNIKHIKVTEKGLSKSRNIGLSYADGYIISFPDDDCQYNCNTLEYVRAKFLENIELDFISTVVYDKNSKRKLVNFPQNDVIIKVKNIFNTLVSASIFIKNMDFSFDENFGVGAKWSSAEETDLVYRLITSGAHGKFFNTFLITHPVGITTQDKKKVYKYALGLGAFYAKHLSLCFDFNLLLMYLVTLIRPLGGILVKPRNYSIFINSFSGRVVGFLKYKK